MPSFTGTLVADAHDLPVLSNTTAANFPFEAFYIDGTTITVPVTFIPPTDPDDWVRGTHWFVIKGRAWPRVEGTAWRRVEKR